MSKRSVNYKVMTLTNARKYLPEARRLKVSEVARSKRGFMGQYALFKTWRVMKNKPVPLYPNQSWQQRRKNFISRHLFQYKKNPTYRHYLALIMWAYLPKKLHNDDEVNAKKKKG